MLRIHCTPEDLLRVTVADQLMPMMELSLAVSMVQRRDPNPVFAPWRQRAGRALPRMAHPMLNLISPGGSGPVFLDPPAPELEEGMDQLLSAPRAEAMTEVRAMCSYDRPLTPWVRHLVDQDREAWQVLDQAVRSAYASFITPSWSRLQAGFRAEIAWRTRIIAQQGLHAALTGLSPSVRMRGLTLEIDHSRDYDVTLQGRGILLQPSLLWDGGLFKFHPDGRFILIYPAVTSLPLCDAPAADDPLVALLGSTRAHALSLLTQQHTTTDLARELSVTAAAASMQAKTLREAGLITSQREGKAVWHWCTPLGLDLLKHTQT